MAKVMTRRLSISWLPLRRVANTNALGLETLFALPMFEKHHDTGVACGKTTPLPIRPRDIRRRQPSQRQLPNDWVVCRQDRAAGRGGSTMIQNA